MENSSAHTVSMERYTPLEVCVIATLAYYDAIGLAMSELETYKYLINPFAEPAIDFSAVALRDVITALDNLCARGVIATDGGLYFFPEHQRLARARIPQQKLADEKWSIFLRDMKILARLPFVELVMASGSLALGNVSAESDFDILIVARDGQIWTTRLITAGILQFFGKRRHGTVTRDRICLNHFVTASSLHIPYKSIYTASSYAHLIPLIDKGNLFGAFMAQNSWIDQWVPFGRTFSGNNQKTTCVQRIIGVQHTASVSSPVSELFSEFLERIARTIQKSRISHNPLSSLSGGRVMITDAALEFHPSSQEGEIIAAYAHTMERFGICGIRQERDSGLY